MLCETTDEKVVCVSQTFLTASAGGQVHPEVLSDENTTSSNLPSYPDCSKQRANDAIDERRNDAFG